MDKNKLIIIALVAIIIILAAALFATNYHAKEDTELKITGNSTFYEGDSIKVKLTDLNGTPISNQTINVTITDKDNTNSYYSVVTNEKGVGKLKLEKDVGNYTVNCTYGGNDKYNGNITSKKITIEEEVVEAQTSSSSYSSSGTNSDDYVYSEQGDKYIKKSGQWDKDSQGNSVYSYQGSDGVIYERYYDKSGNEIDPNDYYK